MKILILKPSSLGDIIHALPVAAALRRARPDARLAWLVNATFADLLRDLPQHAGKPLLEEVIEFPRAQFGRVAQLPHFLAYCRALRDRRFDVALDLQGLLRSGYLARATRAPRRIGLSDAREGARLLYTETIVVPPSATHAVERCLAALEAFAVPRGAVEFPLPQSDALEAWAEQDLVSRRWRFGEGLIGIGFAARWESKRWPPDRFAALMGKLAQKYPDKKILLLGSRSEASLAETILAQLPVPRALSSSVLNFTGQTTLPQLVELLRRCDLFITNDSGPMHIAAALGRPLIALFGPTDPAKVGPYGGHLPLAPFTVLRRGVSLNDITVEEVWEAAQSRLR